MQACDTRDKRGLTAHGCGAVSSARILQFRCSSLTHTCITRPVMVDDWPPPAAAPARVVEEEKVTSATCRSRMSTEGFSAKKERCDGPAPQVPHLPDASGEPPVRPP